jgi:hypothetical protein
VPSLIETHELEREVLSRHEAGDSQQKIAKYVSAQVGRRVPHVNIGRFLKAQATKAEIRRTTITRFTAAMRRLGPEAQRYVEDFNDFIAIAKGIAADTEQSGNVRVRAIEAAFSAIPEGVEMVAEAHEMTMMEMVED